MPSSFEPCGISQLLSMRAGQPCIVNQVGGLKDTINSECGFVFSGDDVNQQASAMVETFTHAIDMYTNDKKKWDKLKANAAAKRFTWDMSAELYVTQLYS